MEKTINLFWHRRDLRTDDNSGLYHALRSGKNVLPLFIFDTDILHKLENKHDKRVEFIYKEVTALKTEYEKNGSTLIVYQGKVLDVFKRLCKQYKVEKVFTNSDYEPYGIQRDIEVQLFLKTQGIEFLSFKDMVIFEKNEILKKDNTPYTVFTPYSKKWKETLAHQTLQNYPSEKLLNNLQQTPPLPLPPIEEIGFKNNNTSFPSKIIDEQLIKHYEKNREIPSANGTSQLSVHLRFGTVSIRKLVKTALEHSEKYLNELIWREFYQMILFHFPHVINSSFKKEYNAIEWSNNEHYFKQWCEGKTGFPLVDAGMRELNETGFMHNRVRMVVASFLVKDLFINWQWGEHYFAQHLLDFELASNNGGWQWAAGCGVDAAPYFRIFNPDIQTSKFDPQYIYIKKWVKEFGSGNYAKPIINHAQAAKETILKYKQMINK